MSLKPVPTQGRFESGEFETPEFETLEFETPEFETPEFETLELETAGIYPNRGSRDGANKLKEGTNAKSAFHQGCAMKRISGLGLAVVLPVLVTMLAAGATRAQDFTAGKTPAQLFTSDCSECHRSAAGLAKGRDVRALSGFLREHYTTKPETAGALAAYVSGIGGTAPPESARSERRGRRDADTTAVEPAKPADDPQSRKRRTTNQSGDGEKPRGRENGEAPRPPGGIAGTAEGAREPTPLPTTRLPRTARGREEEANRARDMRSGERVETPDPLEQLRAYLSTGLGLEGTAAEAAKARPPKSRHRRETTVQAAPEPAAPPAAATTEAPPAAAPTPAPAALPAASGAPAAAPQVVPEAVPAEPAPAAAPAH